MSCGDYVQRKNVCLYVKEMKFLDGLIKKNNNNVSKAIRECIEFTCHVIEQIGSIDQAKEVLYFNQTNDLRVNDRIILRVEKVIKSESKPPDFVLPKGSISEPYGYGDRIYQKLEEKLRKQDSVHIPAQASDQDLDRIEPDHHLDVHGGVD